MLGLLLRFKVLRRVPSHVSSLTTASAATSAASYPATRTRPRPPLSPLPGSSTRVILRWRRSASAPERASTAAATAAGRNPLISAPRPSFLAVRCASSSSSSSSSSRGADGPPEGSGREAGDGSGTGSGSGSGPLGRVVEAASQKINGAANAAREPVKDTMKQALKEAAGETVGDVARSAHETAQSVAASAAAALGHAPDPHPIRPPEERMRSYTRFPGVGTLPQDSTAHRPPGLIHNVWGMDQQRPAYPALTADTDCDVLVVGAGMAGLCTAYQLAKQGHQVIILEARVRGGGQSGRTSAHIMQWNDDFYGVIESKYGKEGARQVAESHLAAIDFHERVVQEEGIECDFIRLDGYLFPHDDKQSTLKMIEDEFEACQRAGMSDVRQVDLSEDPRHGTLGRALLFPRSAEFHPLKYINGLAHVLTSKYGVRLYENTRVTDSLDPQLAGQVATSSGAKVTARKAIVYATNSPINRNVAVHARQEANRTYMIGFKVPKGSVARANWWSTEESYHYIRLQPGDVDGNQPYDVLLVGGEDHQTGQYPSKYSDSWEALEAFTRERWPQAGEVLYRWSGQVYEPVDLLGLYGLDPLNPVNAVSHVKRYIATGDSGQGMTGSAIAALLLADLISGREHPWSALYSPSRITPALNVSSLEELGNEVAATARGLTDTVLPRSGLGLMGHYQAEHLKPGEGAVVQEGVTKVAAFRTPDGRLVKHSAVCPHLGCLLKWNPNDATFDCVCHGSQFDSCGNCINGPANNNLKELF